MKYSKKLTRFCARTLSVLLLVALLVLSVSCGAGKATAEEGVREMSALLDTEGFKAGLTKDAYKSLIAGYRYENLALDRIAELGETSSATKWSYEGFGEAFEFANVWKFTDGADEPYEISASLTATAPLGGLDLPEGVEYGDKFDAVAKRFGLGSGLRAKFSPDSGSETDMTVYSESGYTVVLRNLLRNGDASDDSDPIRLVFTETSESDGQTVLREVTLLFTGGSACVLSGIGLSVTEVVSAQK